MHKDIEKLQAEFGINDIIDFIKPEKKEEIHKFKSILYDWDQGVDIGDQLKEFIRDGLTENDLSFWIQYFSL